MRISGLLWDAKRLRRTTSVAEAKRPRAKGKNLLDESFR